MAFDQRIARAILDMAGRQLSRTVAVKLLYLLDVYVSEENEGQERYTPWRWRFVHFGPFCAEAVNAFEDDDLIEKTAIARDDDVTGTLYRLRDVGAQRHITLGDLGISMRTRMALEKVVRDYSGNLPGLLDMVYFQTAPMQNARRGDVLSFDQCRKPRIDQVRPIKFPAVTSEHRQRAKALIDASRAKRLERSAAMQRATAGAFDDVYFHAMAELGRVPLPDGYEGEAAIDREFGGDT